MSTDRDGQKTNQDQLSGYAVSDLLEHHDHTFIVKIWTEQTHEEAGKVVWRGHITHVLSGTRLYIKDVSEIEAFIIPYLRHMGVKPKLSWRIRHWLKPNRRN